MSVAGLLALGPLTDSLGTTVEFPTTVQTANPVVVTKSSVPVSVTLKNVGTTKTAALRPRGGPAAAPPPTNTDTGFVANRRYTGTKSAASPPPPPPAPPKKQPKRQQSIGTTGETNSDQGFAGGSGSSSTGEQSVTPGT